MSTKPSLTELVKRVVAGDRAAVGLIDTYYKKEIVQMVRDSLNPDNPIRSVYGTNDIAQTVYRRLLEFGASLGSIESGRGLVRTIAANRVCDLGRRQRVTSDAEVAASVVDSAPGPDALAELRDLVQNVMDQLSPAQRELAVRRADGETWPEIAPEDREKVERAFQRACRELTNPSAED